MEARMHHIGGVEVAEDTTLKLSDILWMRRSDVRRICGIGKDLLDDLVADDKVEAHKLNASRNGTVVFSAQDIMHVILCSPMYCPSDRRDTPDKPNQPVA